MSDPLQQALAGYALRLAAERCDDLSDRWERGEAVGQEFTRWVGLLREAEEELWGKG